MKYQCDLHVHSCFSPDAQYTPLQIAARAKKIGLKAVAIADHNTSNGIPAIKSACKRYDIETLEAIEIASRYQGIDMHILGYAISFDLKLLERKISGVIKGYNARAKTMIKKYIRIGLLPARMDFSYFEREKKIYIPPSDIQLAIARYKKTTIETVRSWIARGTKLYVPMPASGMLDPKKTSQIISQCHGISVMAHPYYILRNPLAKGNPKKYLEKILRYGNFRGIEVYYPKHSVQETRLLRSIALDNNLLITGGSDWHGEKYSPEVWLGCRGVNYQTFMKLRNKCQQIQNK